MSLEAEAVEKSRTPGELWTIPLYALLWGVIFYWQPFDFWWLIGAGSVLVMAFSLAIGYTRHELGRWFAPSARRLSLGVVAGIGLYLLFRVGFMALDALFPEFTAARVAELYRMTENIDPGVMTAVLVLAVIPGEELYWRGVIQGAAVRAYGPWIGVFGPTLCYAAVNGWSGNPLQVLAGLVCGLVWGGMAWYTGGLFAPLVTHILWDLALLLWFPLR